MEKKTKYGTIELDNRIFKKILNDAIKETKGKIELFEKKGNLAIDNGEKLYISFDVIVEFGSSIKENTDIVLNYMEDYLKPANFEKTVALVLIVRGMKLKKGNIVDRNIEIIREF